MSYADLRKQHMREAYDWALFNKSAETPISVDHRQPIHDQLCRCRGCKKPLVGERTRRANTIDLIAVAAILLAIIAVTAVWCA